ncbi:MAG: ribosome silencing factor [Sorangiineae bacterium]|nr:ribosome silencing factor [Polyangiaceae bacterium]MEB2322490.1 ribosome silencing factor [Sorangiineae bacterium]
MKLKKPKRPTPSSSRPGAVRLTRPDTARAQAIALEAARAGLDKKAGGVEIIDVTGKVDYADYLVVMTGQSDRHVAAIADSVEAELAKSGTRAISTEGLPVAEWVLIDFVDVVVHVFVEELRSLYDLDGLWMDARRIPVPDDAPGGG